VKKPIYNLLPRHSSPPAAIVFTLAALLISVPALSAQPSAATNLQVAAEDAIDIPVASVVVDGEKLLRVRGYSAYPAEIRAARIAGRINALAADDAVPISSLHIEDVDGVSRIVAGEQLVMTVTDADAKLELSDRQVLGKVYATRISEAIRDYRSARTAARFVRSGLLTLAATAVLVVLLWLGARAMSRLEVALERRIKHRLVALEERSLRILSAAQLWQALNGLRSLLWTAAILAAVVIYLDFLLHLFPWTRGFGEQLLALLTDPLFAIGRGALDALPNLLVLAVIIVLVRYALRALHLLFAALESGSVTIAAFEREWATPTYRLVRLLVLALAVVVAYPYIPGSESNAFKGVSIFLGVIFSLGSTSLIGNIIAGYSLTYRRAFRVGDRVRIGDYVGDVSEMRLLVTHLCTPKNEEVIIPNSEILSRSVVNYSTFAHAGKLILHATVGIGYEVPWRQVEAMLIRAAVRTEGLLSEPAPFVLQKELGDFAVTYEINVYCDKPQLMNRLYARLYRSILDEFNEFGIQIMTPSYEGDPAQPKIVPKDKWYAAPASQHAVGEDAER
jgi:small-conductance mechanosensitive channel